MVTITLRQASRIGNYKKPWVARINGTHPKFKLDREFVAAKDETFGGQWTFELGEGLYEICDRNSKGAERRAFIQITADAAAEKYLSDEEFGLALKAAATPREVTTGQLRQEVVATVRTNSEGAILASAPGQSKGRYSCWECGYETDDPSEIEPGNMGCVRCG